MEFCEVDFSERRNFEATHKIPTSKNKFWWRNLQGFGTVKFLLVASPVTNEVEFWRPASAELFSRAFLSSAEHNQEQVSRDKFSRSSFRWEGGVFFIENCA